MLRAALGSLLITWAFLFEYRPPFRRVRIPYDLENFHHPLADYAFQALRQWRIPEWDPTIYCGMPFAANPQVALFYPGTWVLMLANWGRERLTYQSLQDFVLAHVWLACLFSYLWLRKRDITPIAAAFGAGIYAFGGYMMLQLQHLALVIVFAWMPFGLAAIDEAARRRQWRPLWKLALASTMCVLAGYPPAWIVFATASVTWAAILRNGARAATALAFSLLLAAVQLLPSWELAILRVAENNYGTGIRDPLFFVSYVLPNYFDFAIGSPHVHLGEYLYIGAAGIVGVLALVRRPTRQAIAPLATLGVAMALMTNPFGAVGFAVSRFEILGGLVRDWYFLAAIHASLAVLAAHGLDGWLRAPAVTARMPNVIPAVIAFWAAAQLMFWHYGGKFDAGWPSAIHVAVSVLLVALGIWAWRRDRRMILAGMLALLVYADLKVFGTSKRINAAYQVIAPRYQEPGFVAVDADAYRELLANRHYRVATDPLGPHPARFRHAGLATPQGMDPLLSAPYRREIDTLTAFRTNREFDLDPSKPEALRRLGVRYFITAAHAPSFATMSASPEYRLLEPSHEFYKVFELRAPEPPWRWSGRVEMLTWEPERRRFRIDSGASGEFVLVEQLYPGWTATVDGMPAEIARDGAFQKTRLGPGEHVLEFRYRSMALRWGAGISFAAMLLLVAWARSSFPGSRNAGARTGS